MKLVLASTSPYRRALLERLSIPFECVDPGVDEAPLQALGLAPEELAPRLARAKAEAAAREDAIVIGSDQVCAFEGESFGKPGTEDAAIQRLLAMSGKEHQLITAVCLVTPARRVEFVDVTRLWLKELSEDEAHRYVQLDDTAHVAGGYKLEQHGIALFDRIETEDSTAIVGLPLIRLRRELDALREQPL